MMLRAFSETPSYVLRTTFALLHQLRNPLVLKLNSFRTLNVQHYLEHVVQNQPVF